LSTALWHIRRVLPSGDYILADAKTLQFNPRSDYWFDVEAFLALLSADEPDIQDLQRAVNLYRGDLLEGFYDDWILNKRYQLESQFMEALARLMRAHEEQREYEAVLAAALRLLDCDPLREDGHRAAMRAYGRLGQRNAALEQYARCREIVHTELGAEPMIETTELYQAILGGHLGPERGPRAISTWSMERPSSSLPSQRSPITLSGQTPLVGRVREMSLLRNCWEQAAAGEGCLVLIRGEPGIGKTRLAEEACHHVRQRGRWIITANCYEYEHALPHGPLTDILRGAIAIAGDHCVRRLSSWQIAALARLAPELAAHLPARSEHVLPTESEQTRLFNALTSLLLDLARQNSLLLVLEDLQWAHDSTRAWLHHLARHLHDAPLLALATYRPGEADPARTMANMALQLQRQGLAVILRLTRLSQDDLAQWMEGASASLVTEIYRHTEGNPFFILETQRALLEEGQLRLHEGRWLEVAAREDLPIPDSVRQVIQMRLNRLSPRASRALDVAAVIGRTFDLDVLERAWGQGEEVTLEALDELLRRRLVREGNGPFGKDYTFDHHLVRDVIYERLAPHHCRRLHGRVAEALLELHGRKSTVSAEVAYHYIQAEDWAQAQDHFFQAADQAGRAAADSEALAYYRQALTAYERAFGDRWQPGQRAILERKMGESFFRAGDHTQALDHLHRALAHLGRPFPTAPRAVRREILTLVMRQLGRRLVPTRLRRRAATPIPPAVEEEVQTYFVMGWIYALLSHYEPYLLVSLRALHVSERERFARGEALAATALGTAADFIPFFRVAGYFHRRAARIAEQLTHPGAIGFVYQGLAYHHYLLGELERALKYAQKSAAAYQDADDHQRWALVTLLMAYIHDYRGGFSWALACARDLVRTGEEVANPWALCAGEEMLGIVQRHLGHLEEATSHLQHAVALASQIPDHMSLAESSGELGKCYLRQGQWQQALEVVEEQQHLIVEHDVKGDSLGRFLNALAETYLWAAEADGGEASQDWLQKADRACRAALKQGRAFRPGLPEAMRLRGQYEWLKGDHQAARQWWQRSLEPAEAMGHRYDLALTHLEMSRRLGERASLDRAQALLAEIGADWRLTSSTAHHAETC
jgi:predicted ATPase/DNA-binding SARP family transcriptional activator